MPKSLTFMEKSFNFLILRLIKKGENFTTKVTKSIHKGLEGASLCDLRASFVSIVVKLFLK